MLNDMESQPLKQNWASCVKDLLSRLGFMEVWEMQGVGNIGVFMNIFKQRVRDSFIQNWHERLENSTRLRLSSHRLEVEVGRWAKPNKVPYENRKCKNCDV